jgi:hypothetical protein
MAAATKA